MGNPFDRTGRTGLADGIKDKARRYRHSSLGPSLDEKSGFGLGLDDLATPIKASRADVMSKVGFTRGGLNRDTWDDECIISFSRCHC